MKYVKKFEKSGNLISAAMNNDIKLVQYLINDGIDLNMRDKDGNTALISAAEHGHIDIVKLLIVAGANWYLRDNQGKDFFDHLYWNKKKIIYWTYDMFPGKYKEYLTMKNALRDSEKYNI